MITESTGIPDAVATTEPPAAAQEPSQEAVLTELRTARKEGKEPDFSIAPKAEPTTEPPKEPALNNNEQKLKDKHGGNYKPSQDRQRHKAKIDEMTKRIAELEAKWKDAPPTQENQMEFTEDKFEHKTLAKELDEKINEYRAEIKSELADKYNSDETFKAQHDHWGDMVFRETEGAAELTDLMLSQPNGIQILSNLYSWLDLPGSLEIWLHTTPEQRLSAVKVEADKMRYMPRVPPASTAVQANSAASQATNVPASPTNPVIPMSVKPDPAGTGGKAGLDLNKQEDCLKYVRQKRKEMV